jgi:hypothetical protein
MKSFWKSGDRFSEVLISDILFSGLIPIGTLAILMIREVIRGGQIDFDFLGIFGVLTPLVLFGPPVIVTSIVSGSVAYYLYAKK